MSINLYFAVSMAFVTGAVMLTNPWYALLGGIFCVLNTVVVHKMLVDRRG